MVGLLTFDQPPLRRHAPLAPVPDGSLGPVHPGCCGPVRVSLRRRHVSHSWAPVGRPSRWQHRGNRSRERASSCRGVVIRIGPDSRGPSVRERDDAARTGFPVPKVAGSIPVGGTCLQRAASHSDSAALFSFTDACTPGDSPGHKANSPASVVSASRGRSRVGRRPARSRGGCSAVIVGVTRPREQPHVEQ